MFFYLCFLFLFYFSFFYFCFSIFFLFKKKIYLCISIFVFPSFFFYICFSILVYLSLFLYLNIDYFSKKEIWCSREKEGSYYLKTEKRLHLINFIPLFVSVYPCMIQYIYYFTKHYVNSPPSCFCIALEILVSL